VRKRKDRSVPPIFIPKIAEQEAIAIATEFARSQGVATDGCRGCTWGFGGYLIDLKKPASEIEIAKPDEPGFEDPGFIVSPASTYPESAIVVTIDDRTGAAERFYLL